MMKLLKSIILLFEYVRFLPHIIFYLTSPYKGFITCDIGRYKSSNHSTYDHIKNLVELLAYDIYFRNVFYARIGRVSKLFKWIANGESTFKIYSTCNIAEGMYAPHAFATVINAQSIGKNFTIRQCTTIGNKIDGRNDLIPVIGDNVTIGSNVCIIGSVKIGNNVTVGAGSVVIRDIPDYAIVVGNPGRVIGYINKE